MKQVETGLSKSRVISELLKAPHGSLREYVGASSPLPEVAKTDPDFLAHMIAWNARHGSVRDAKVALPVVAIAYMRDDEQGIVHAENALAHLATLDPKDFLRALDFAKDVKARSRVFGRLAARYLADFSARPDWERAALQHRRFIQQLYARPYTTGRLDPPEHVNALVFGPSRKKPVKPIPAGYGALFAAVHDFGRMSVETAVMLLRRLPVPFLAARGGLGEKVREPDVLEALIPRMSQTELTSNAKWLERLGVRSSATLRATMEQALGRAVKPGGRGGQLKATKAAETLERAGDVTMAAAMRGLQERQIDAGTRIKGNWLVLGDKSQSMTAAIEGSRRVAATLARYAEGTVSLIFFDTSPRFFDATGLSYEALLILTAGITPGGGTSIGCGLDYAVEKGLKFDGVAIASDAAENESPLFATVYRRYAAKVDVPPSVYLYRFACGARSIKDVDLAVSCRAGQIELTEFDLRQGFDYTSLPNLVLTMRPGRYALLDEIYGTPLKRLDDVLKRTKDVRVLPQSTPVPA
jgi:hypothetical protein